MAFIYIFSAFLHMIDIFGLKTEFQIDKQSKFKTSSGGFFTLVYVGFIILLFFSFGGDMISRQNPETTVSQTYERMPAPTIVSKDHYFFVFGLQNSSAIHFIDEEIYTPILIYGRKNEKTLEIEEISLKAKPCEDSDLPTNHHLIEYFHVQSENISALYCVPHFNETIVLQGAWDQPRFGYLRVGVQPCNSSERTCKSDEEIKKMLISSYFALYGTDYLFDLTNFESPAQVFGRDYFIPTSYTQSYQIYRYFRTDEVLSDEGWITNSVKKNSFFSFDYNDASFAFQTGFGPMVRMELRKSNYATTQSRKYKKIQSVFAEMTGFLQIIFVGLYFISGPFIKREYYETLTNSIYNFEVDENSQAEIDKKNKKRHKNKQGTLEQKEKFKNIVQSNQKNKGYNEAELIGSPKSNYTTKKNKNDEKIASFYLKSKETPLKMTITETIKSKLTHDPDLEAKKSQRNTGISSIFSQLDIKYVLKKFSELDKLKMLLLNEDQYNLFEYLPKPVILKNSKIHLNYVKEKSLSPAKKSTFSGEIIHHHNDIISKARAVQRALNNIMKKKDEMSDIDKKLIETMDQNLIALLLDDEPADVGRGGTKQFIIIPRPPSSDFEKESIFLEKKEDIIVKNSEINYKK